MDRVDYQTIVIQDLINLNKEGQLDLNPWYQRRSVWSLAQKSYLINSLLEQKPIPAIYVRHSLDLERSRSIKEVVDGQQRCRSIIGFTLDEFSSKHPNHEKKVKFSQLKSDEQQKYLLTAIPVGYLLGANDEDVIEIFGRINSISKSLNAQEKRNAAYSGEMKQLCLKQASSRINFWRNYGIFTANDIARMNETQFISDIVFNFINGLSDYSSTKLDAFYKAYDESFDDSNEISARLDKCFDRIASLPPERISDTIFNRSPILFSLIIVIDDIQPSTEALEEVVLEIDERYNSEENKTQQDIEFVDACKSTTQRIAQRRVRDQYIRSFF
ncbi:DUF262 domain-containing protein [Pseudidiomarina donghaiensis]|nr:DUF262 domain-containing protein [Pseudidiomarina donghaiensis]SFV20326.1 Protein of unknown function DUF262 [Pseudidiomarina donghaiensis]